MPDPYSPSDAFSNIVDANPGDDADAISLEGYTRPIADRTRYLARRLGGGITEITIPAAATTVVLPAQANEERVHTYTLISVQNPGDPTPVVTAPASASRADGDTIKLRIFGDKAVALGAGFVAPLPALLKGNTFEFQWSTLVGGFALVGSVPLIPVLTAERRKYQAIFFNLAGAPAGSTVLRRETLTPRLQTGDVIRADALASFKRDVGGGAGTSGTLLILRIVSTVGGIDTIEEEATVDTGEHAGAAAVTTRVPMSAAMIFVLPNTPSAGTTHAVELVAYTDGTADNAFRTFENIVLLTELHTQGPR